MAAEPGDQGIRARRLSLIVEMVGTPLAIALRLARDAVVLGTLIHAGYRGWRLAAVIGLLFGIAFVPVVVARLVRRRNRELPGVTVALLAQGLATAVMALTGGMYSPVLPGVAALAVLPAKMWGSERHADRLSVVLVLMLAVLALLPASVTGPRLDRAHHAVILIATFIWAYVVIRIVMLRVRDVTDQADHELHLLREAQVADAEARTSRLQHVGARVAHELKNPLSAIKGLVQLVARGVPAPRADRLGDVLGELERVQGVVKAYLSFSRPLEPAAAAVTAAAVPTVESTRRERNHELMVSVVVLVGRIIVITAAMMVALLTLLALSGMPRSRVATMIAIFAAFAAIQRSVLALLTRRSERRGDTRAGIATPFVTANLIGQLWISSFLAISGGVYSPLLPLVAANLMLTGVFEVVGVRRAILVAVMMIALLAGVAVLPPSLTGPGVATWHHDAIMVLTVTWAVVMIRAFTTHIAAASNRAAEAVEAMRAARLRDSEAMTQRLRDVAARVADELRPPLEHMHATVTAVLAETGEPRPAERLRVVAGELARMQIIVGDYLSATRPLEDLEPESVDLAALAGESAAVVAGRAEDGEVAVELHAGAAHLRADPRRLREALLNVLSNALDATPAGGTVRVETAPTEGGGATITVVDSGRGMAPEVLARLGQSFVTTRVEGTGLGVVLVKGVVAQHGGTIAYDSSPGRGTRVTITLPARPPGPPGLIS